MTNQIQFKIKLMKRADLKKKSNLETRICRALKDLEIKLYVFFFLICDTYKDYCCKAGNNCHFQFPKDRIC